MEGCVRSSHDNWAKHIAVRQGMCSGCDSACQGTDLSQLFEVHAWEVEQDVQLDSMARFPKGSKRMVCDEQVGGCQRGEPLGGLPRLQPGNVILHCLGVGVRPVYVDGNSGYCSLVRAHIQHLHPDLSNLCSCCQVLQVEAGCQLLLVCHRLPLGVGDGGQTPIE